MKPITFINLGLACLCLVGAFIFFVLKEKGAMLVSGFDSIPKNKKDDYDKKQISLDMRNALFLWGVVLLIGAILSQIIHEYFGVGAMCLFFILVINSFGTFDRYRK